ncbi:MAG: 4-(cytidine 5'-diphospho)-2-C-methyl-D-erythritol kinase [Clostridia bacterium]|nr:4-(cytidine 5'-diphospho)-2-C-methyl-D-erythritol kinase [Clostridia bacterium]
MKLLANAKLNLTLDIAGKREDGYHLIDSVFQSISLCDEINIEKADAVSVVFSEKSIPANESVAYRSARAFFEFTGLKGGAKIYIKNNIPTGSGMGGGSSDAAAVLKGLDSLYGTRLTTDELINIAAPIGADIPFCLVGGTARVSGIGEKVSPLPSIGEYPIIIIKDKEKSSTADMYRSLDNIKKPPEKTALLIKAIKNGDNKEIFKNISNAFSGVTDIEKERSDLTNSGASAVGLTGSGPSVFGIFRSKDIRNKAFDTLSKNHKCFKAEFSEKGIIIE